MSLNCFENIVAIVVVWVLVLAETSEVNDIADEINAVGHSLGLE